MTLTKMLALATTAALLPASAFAQTAPAETSGCCGKDAKGQMTCCDKDADGTMACCAKMKAGATEQPDASGHSTMDQSTMNHGEMDHSKMDHGTMDHSAMDHGTMSHGAMNHGSMAHPPAKAEPVSPSSADRPSTAR